MASTENSNELYEFMCVICGHQFPGESDCKEHIAAEHHVTSASGNLCRIPRGYRSTGMQRSTKKVRKRLPSKKEKNTNLQPNKRIILPGKEGLQAKRVKTIKLLPTKKEEMSLKSNKITRKKKSVSQKRKKSDFSEKKKPQTKRARRTSSVSRRKRKSAVQSNKTTPQSKKLSQAKKCDTSYLLPPCELMNDHLLHQLPSSESKEVSVIGLGESESSHDVTVVWSTDELRQRNWNENDVSSRYLCYYCRTEFATIGLCRLHMSTNHKNKISTLISKTNEVIVMEKNSRERKQVNRRSRIDTMMSPDSGSVASKNSIRLPTIDDLLTLSSCVLAFQVWEGEPTPKVDGEEIGTCDGRDLGADGHGDSKFDAVDGTDEVVKTNYQCSECSQKFPTLEECIEHMKDLHLPKEGEGAADDFVSRVVYVPAISKSNDDENSIKSVPCDELL